MVFPACIFADCAKPIGGHPADGHLQASRMVFGQDIKPQKNRRGKIDMKLEDTLFNWLQIRLVADARPEDNAAKETVDFFRTALLEDHLVDEVDIVTVNEDLLQVHYRIGDEKLHRSYDLGYAYQLLNDINGNPKYNE